MSQAASILQLLAKLRSGNSYLSRMKIISQLWEIFSKLNQKDRAKLLVKLGLKGTEEGLEKFLSNPGTNYFEILDLAHFALKKLSPEQVDQLTMGHLSTEESERLLSAVQESVAEEVEESEVSPPAPPIVPEPEMTVHDDQSDSTLKVDKEPASATIEPIFREDELESKHEEQSSPVNSDENERVVAEVAMPLAAEEDETDRELKIETEEEKREISTVESVPAKKEKLHDETIEIDQSEFDSKSEQKSEREDSISPPVPLPRPELQETTSLTDRLKEFSVNESEKSPLDFYPEKLPGEISSSEYNQISRDPDILNDWELMDLDRYLKRLPAGWMRRRLLTRYLEEQTPSVDQALINLIQENVQRPSDYLWYAGALLRNCAPESSMIDEILNLAPSPLIRRRLERMVH